MIASGDVETLYAHCKTIYVKEGDEIYQGQEIGQTGATGNVTGPHLHFEIRNQGRYVNPDLILTF
jgi:murein DD-endopeptidase MepM/ murein hydrolase activator NlpD